MKEQTFIDTLKYGRVYLDSLWYGGSQAMIIKLNPPEMACVAIADLALESPESDQ